MMKDDDGAETEAATEADQAPALPDAQDRVGDPGATSEKAGLDPRINPYREDLAAAGLEGRIDAPRYVEGEFAQVIESVVPVRGQPHSDAPATTEVLFGEIVTVFEIADGWAWVQMARDQYVGYLDAAALSTDVRWPTHRVKSLGTYVYPARDIKQPPIAHLGLNACVAVREADSLTPDGEKPSPKDDLFYELETGGFVISRHLSAESKFARDYVDVAERFIGTPYLWGGCSHLGIDCSGLVQMSLLAAGIDAPRDSDLQENALGETVELRKDFEGVERGDLVFWKGHVGIMSDGIMIVHANAHHMAVTVETLPEVASRVARSGSQISSIRRIDQTET